MPGKFLISLRVVQVWKLICVKIFVTDRQTDKSFATSLLASLARIKCNTNFINIIYLEKKLSKCLYEWM